jgi:hypothetical protein
MTWQHVWSYRLGAERFIWTSAWRLAAPSAATSLLTKEGAIFWALDLSDVFGSIGGVYGRPS